MSVDRAITIAIASGKGGVGKSFLALNLALCLGELGQTVSLIELDADAGALSIAVGLGEPKATAPALDARTLAARAISIPGNARVQLIRSADIPTTLARSPTTLGPLLTHLTTRWHIVDLSPGIGSQNVLWLRRATPAILIGTPELVAVQAMLRLQLQLKRQHIYEYLCSREPRLRGGPASLTAAKQRLTEFVGEQQASNMSAAAVQTFVSPRWVFNRVLSDDTAQLARIGSYLTLHAGPLAASPWTIPEDLAQARCARYGRIMIASEPTCAAAQSVRAIAAQLIALQTPRSISIASREQVA
jgi:MinD-like ATPase involved in chromosome partitioning or flagellar assembly